MNTPQDRHGNKGPAKRNFGITYLPQKLDSPNINYTLSYLSDQDAILNTTEKSLITRNNLFISQIQNVKQTQETFTTASTNQTTNNSMQQYPTTSTLPQNHAQIITDYFENQLQLGNTQIANLLN
jgi:hypothetical protein